MKSAWKNKQKSAAVLMFWAQVAVIIRNLCHDPLMNWTIHWKLIFKFERQKHKRNPLNLFKVPHRFISVIFQFKFSLYGNQADCIQSVIYRIHSWMILDDYVVRVKNYLHCVVDLAAIPHTEHACSISSGCLSLNINLICRSTVQCWGVTEKQAKKNLYGCQLAVHF